MTMYIYQILNFHQIQIEDVFLAQTFDGCFQGILGLHHNKLDIKLQVYKQRMGNKAETRISCPRCMKLLGRCQKCHSCLYCSERSCCRLLNGDIELKINEPLFHNIYNKGEITHIQGIGSIMGCCSVSINNVVNSFAKSKLSHFSQKLRIKLTQGISQNILIGGYRGRDGKMKICIKYYQPGTIQFQQVALSRPVYFHQFHRFLVDEILNQQYDRYTNNCYHFSIACLQKLEKDMSNKYNPVKQINELKDKQVKNFWG